MRQERLVAVHAFNATMSALETTGLLKLGIIYCCQCAKSQDPCSDVIGAGVRNRR